MQNDFAQNQQPEKATTLVADEPDSSHNTPPPVLFGNGSFLVEKEIDYAAGEVVTTGANTKHHIKPDPTHTQIFPAHIKVIDGSGEKLYQKDGANNCVITFTLSDGDTVTAQASSGKKTFMIETANGKTLDKSAERPTAKKRKVRYALSKGGMTSFSITKLEITDGPKPEYDVTLASLPSKGDDFKVMVWLEQA